MPRRITTVITDFSKCVRDSRKIAADAATWSIPVPPATSPLISPKRRDMLIELAFFRTFSAWESFLEESFILYMLGQQPPRGRRISRYGFPPNEDAAYEWVADGRSYANWTVEHVKARSKRLFKDGHPFHAPLSSHSHLLQQVKTIRNSIAHESEDARQKFEALVRNELTALPRNTTPGSFLLTTKPRTTPPVSFFEFYLDQVVRAAQMIVPT